MTPGGPAARWQVMGRSTAPSQREGKIPTVTGFPNLRRAVRARSGRRVFVALLFTFLGLGAAGVFGSRTSSVTAADRGYELTVTYPSVTRPGLAIRYAVRVRHSGGFTGPIELMTTSEYLDLFDENGFDPEPTEITTTAEDTIWTFDTFRGDVLTVSFDARTEPARESGRSGTTTLMVQGDQIVSVRYRTWVMP